MPEQIEYQGIAYEIVAFGVISELYRKHNKFTSTEEPPESQVQICTKWLQLYATPRKTMNTAMGSYGLKHVVERWAGEYVCNGAFILAAHRLGYKIAPMGILNPNTYFFMSFPKSAISPKN